jgi:3-oxoadipate enol-lactonase
MRTSIHGIQLAYRAAGAGRSPALLLIHGFPLDNHLWDAQLRGLAAEAHVIAPDLRGHGRSDAPAGPYTMEQHADDLAGLLDHLGIQGAVVAGLSMGGYIAFALWRRHPGRVQGLILLDTRAEPDTPEGRKNRDVTAARVPQIGARGLAEEQAPRLLAPASLANLILRQRTVAMLARQRVAGIVAALGGLRDRVDSRPTLPTITVPTLVIVGAEDALTPPTDARTIADGIPGARLAIIPGAGHLSPLERPRTVNAALRGFLRQFASPLL